MLAIKSISKPTIPLNRMVGLMGLSEGVGGVQNAPPYAKLIVLLVNGIHRIFEQLDAKPEVRDRRHSVKHGQCSRPLWPAVPDET